MAPHHYHRKWSQNLTINNLSSERKYDDAKPYLVIHVGPHKTGTTTLQDALWDYNKEGILAKDQYYYGNVHGYDTGDHGKLMDKDCHWKLYRLRNAHRVTRGGKCITNSKFGSCYDNSTEESDEYNISRTELMLKLIEVPCWNDVLQRLNGFAMNKTSLIISKEAWTFNSNRIWTERGHSLVDWKTMSLTLKDTWNIILVLGYRRYPEWIFSSWNQENKYFPTRAWLKRWPAGDRGKIIPISPLPTKRSEMMSIINWRYSDHLLKEFMNNPEIDYEILNMHDLRGGGLVSLFACGILPDAYHTCQHSLQKERESASEKRLNPSESLFFDALGCGAHEMGLLNDKHQRPSVMFQVKDYYINVLNGSNPMKDFPLVCPSRDEYEGFLNLSLSLEQETVPTFFGSHVEEHCTNFWKQVEANKFCFIDVASTLKQPEWKHFFEEVIT